MQSIALGDDEPELGEVFFPFGEDFFDPKDGMADEPEGAELLLGDWLDFGMQSIELGDAEPELGDAEPELGD